MIEPVLYDIAQEAIDFASSMIDDGLWRAGCGKASATKFDRAQDVIRLGLELSHERWLLERSGKSVAAIDEMMSDHAVELSKLAIAAIDDRSMRLAHFDP